MHLAQKFVLDPALEQAMEVGRDALPALLIVLSGIVTDPTLPTPPPAPALWQQEALAPMSVPPEALILPALQPALPPRIIGESPSCLAASSAARIVGESPSCFAVSSAAHIVGEFLSCSAARSGRPQRRLKLVRHPTVPIGFCREPIEIRESHVSIVT